MLTHALENVIITGSQESFNKQIQIQGNNDFFFFNFLDIHGILHLHWEQTIQLLISILLQVLMILVKTPGKSG